MDPAASDNVRPADEGPDDGPSRGDENADTRPADGPPRANQSADAPTDQERTPATRRLGRVLGRGAAAVLALTLLGAPLGLLWAALAPDVPVIKTADGAVLAQPQPEEFIAADGWFSLLGLGFGVLVAVGVWWLLPRWRGPAGMLVSVIGALGAALLAWAVGRQIGLDAYQEQLRDAAIGQALAKPADLRAGGFEWVFDIVPTVQGDVLLGAFGAAVTCTLLAGWSSYPDLVPGRPEESAAGAISWDSPETPDQRGTPAPPEPDEAGPVRG